MNGKPPETAFTKKLDERVNETKGDEEKRREYMLLKSFEMDARRAGIAEGMDGGGFNQQRCFAEWQNSCFPIDTDVYRKTRFLCR